MESIDRPTTAQRDLGGHQDRRRRRRRSSLHSHARIRGRMARLGMLRQHFWADMSTSAWAGKGGALLLHLSSHRSGAGNISSGKSSFGCYVVSIVTPLKKAEPTSHYTILDTTALFSPV